MGIELFASLGRSLSLTLLLELCFFLAYRLVRRRGLRGALSDTILVVLVNILTNPVVVLSYVLLMSYTRLPEWTIVLPLEVAAVAVEALCYKFRAEDIPRPFLFSLAANALSYGTGLLIRFVF